jgi:hypothetical protein
VTYQPVALAEAVGEPASGENSGGAADQEDGGKKLAAVDESHVEAPSQDRRRPGGKAIARDRAQRCGEAISQKVGFPGHDRETSWQRTKVRRSGGRARLVAHEVEHDGCQQDSGNAHDDECGAPVDPRRKIGSDQRSEGQPERDSEREDRERAGPPRRREIIGDQRVGRSDSAGFTDPHAEAEDEQLPEIGRKSRTRQ